MHVGRTHRQARLNDQKAITENGFQVAAKKGISN